MDVEMQIQASLTKQRTVVVLDTNILLEFLGMIQTFVSEVEDRQLPVMIIIPKAVIDELDAQKKCDRLSWVARRACTWLFKKAKERKSVRSQAVDETCRSSGDRKITERTNDGLILDCCRYFGRQSRTILCSKDKLLAVEAESVAPAGIPSLFPNQAFGRDLSVAVFGAELSNDDDGMDVDDNSVTELVLPSHPLDQLHLEVIDHFGELLRELVAGVAGPDAAQFGAVKMASMHAPGYARKLLMFWTTTDALEYLRTRKTWAQTSPRVEIFLRRPYDSERGARRGQDWSRRDWEVVLNALGRIGDLWADSVPGTGIGESARAVLAHLHT